jgi:putative holliday junction resolvase
LATLLAFDYGSRKIGVAVGQTVTGTANPLVVLRNRGKTPDWPGIERLLTTWRPQALVVGLPLNMDDTEASAAPGAQRFARQIGARSRLPVFLVDERLTSNAARRAAPPIRGRVDVDDLAATLILETWLSEHPSL